MISNAIQGFPQLICKTISSFSSEISWSWPFKKALIACSSRRLKCTSKALETIVGNTPLSELIVAKINLWESGSSQVFRKAFIADAVILSKFSINNIFFPLIADCCNRELISLTPLFSYISQLASWIVFCVVGVSIWIVWVFSSSSEQSLIYKKSLLLYTPRISSENDSIKLVFQSHFCPIKSIKSGFFEERLRSKNCLIYVLCASFQKIIWIRYDTKTISSIVFGKRKSIVLKYQIK